MKVTKYEHACLDITEGDTRLIIDPGVFSHSIKNFSEVSVLVITHIHPDHFDPEKIQSIIDTNPDVSIFTTSEVAKQIKYKNITVPETSKSYSVGTIKLEFFGKDHAVIVPSYPLAQNIGVLVNEKLYYPGDSFTNCPKSHQVVAVPAHAPWLKFNDAADFLTVSNAKKMFPTHNGFLNDDGDALMGRLFGGICEATGKEYQLVKPGETIEIN